VSLPEERMERAAASASRVMTVLHLQLLELQDVYRTGGVLLIITDCGTECVSTVLMK
jgi:hypothetical protein